MKYHVYVHANAATQYLFCLSEAEVKKIIDAHDSGKKSVSIPGEKVIDLNRFVQILILRDTFGSNAQDVASYMSDQHGGQSYQGYWSRDEFARLGADVTREMIKFGFGEKSTLLNLSAVPEHIKDLNQTKAANAPSGTTGSSEPMVKHIFLDVVGFTRDNRIVEAQAAIIHSLNEIVLKVLMDHEIPSEPNRRRLLPTGDGLCICLLNADGHDIQLRIALEILKGIASHNGTADLPDSHCYEIRIGLNMKHDLLVDDINRNPNVAGSGINTASRLMDAAGPSQILMSENVQLEINDREGYAGKLKKGKILVKHDKQLTAYQYVDDQLDYLNSTTVVRFVQPLAVEHDPVSVSQSQASLTPRSKKDWDIRMPEWEIEPIYDTPQHTASRDVPLRGRLFEGFHCRLHIESDYIRFGFKLLGHGMDLFGNEKNVKDDSSHLLHIGKEKDGSTITGYHYQGSKVVDHRPHLMQWNQSSPIDFEMHLSESGTLCFKVQQIIVCNFPILPKYRQRLVMMAWGDGNNYKMTVNEIEVQTSKA